MKKTQRMAAKVHRNFKLDPALNSVLKREARKNYRTETAVVEMALRRLFNMESGRTA